METGLSDKGQLPLPLKSGCGRCDARSSPPPLGRGDNCPTLTLSNCFKTQDLRIVSLQQDGIKI